jgi:hypothetical protein
MCISKTVFLSHQSSTHSTYPSYLDFIWDPKHVERGVSGETKQSYQQKLTSSYSIGADYAGFGAEVNLSFEEDSFDETDMKYAGLYIQEQTYTLRFSKTNSTDVRKHLSKNAKDSFAKDDAGTIVQRWGTHYLESATFGGMKRITSVSSSLTGLLASQSIPLALAHLTSKHHTPESRYSRRLRIQLPPQSALHQI